jgi:hypothetical protein
MFNTGGHRMRPKCPKSQKMLIAENLRFVKRLVSRKLPPVLLEQLRELTRNFSLSLKCGDLLLLNNGWYVTHVGLIRLAKRCRCSGIQVHPVDQLSDQATSRYAFRATVYKSDRCRGFVGYGDADPSNVSPLVRGAEMRIAETRAVNRALRKAYGIGICSVEEIGSGPGSVAVVSEQDTVSTKNTNCNGHTVRDRLCQIIRQHKLDPELVKAYAVDFCGTTALKDATREQVEHFVQQLADAATKDRSTLLCQLNSYARSSQEVVG